MCGAGNEARQRSGGYRASLQALRENQERNYREVQEAVEYMKTQQNGLLATIKRKNLLGPRRRFRMSSSMST